MAAYYYVNIASVCEAESPRAPVTVWTLSKTIALFLPRLYYKIHRCMNRVLQHCQTFDSINTLRKCLSITEYALAFYHSRRQQWHRLPPIAVTCNKITDWVNNEWFPPFANHAGVYKIWLPLCMEVFVYERQHFRHGCVISYR